MVSVCLPSDASCNTYRLTWVSLTLDVGYLFRADPAKHSHCSLHWTRGVSSLLPLLTLTWKNRREIDGETVETVSDFIFWGSKITADGDYSHEIKRCLFLERKVMSNLDSILKIRDVTLPIKVHLVKTMVFPMVIYGCESWTVKKAQH